MKKLAQLVVAAFVVTIPLTASAQNLTEAQARAVIASWYVLFNQPVQGDMRALQEQVLTADYESCWGYLPGECWGRDTSIKVVGGFAKSIPDMKFDIKEVLIAGDRVIVRGEVTGTPAGDLFGVSHTGKSFRIMAIDIQTIRDGKISQTYHLENWLSALGQLRAKYQPAALRHRHDNEACATDRSRGSTEGQARAERLPP
jgi:ketosteroid isomerase-like protein